jgi:peptidylprolyl isomerase
LRGRDLKLLAAGVAALTLGACGYADPQANSGSPAAVSQTTPTPVGGVDDFKEGAGKTPVKFPDGLQILDLKQGTGDTVGTGATVMAQYTGWLNNGTKFDSSRDRGQPLCAILANVQSQGTCTSVIPGWNEGIPGMKVGGKRKLTIPPALAYGDQGVPPTIPASSTLVFTIEVASIVSNKPPPSANPAPSPT